MARAVNDEFVSRRSCCRRCLGVGMVAVVAIVLSVAVHVAGGESVRNMCT